MDTVQADIVIVGAGGGGLRAAIAATQANPDCTIALLSKVYPMRSHTVAAEGGAAGVVQDHDSLQAHFEDTVSGGDWLCDQDAVDHFIEHATEELIQLEHWGCPWSRKADGHVNVRAFGGMKIERTWFAADKSGFHMLHTLFQTSMQFPNIKRFDEYFCAGLIIEDDRCQGVVAIDIASGEPRTFLAPSVILATGGAGRVFQFNTNAGIVTGDGMSMAYRAGAALRDMEFVQYHPTALPASGILMTEGSVVRTVSSPTKTAVVICKTTTSVRPTLGHAKKLWNSVHVIVSAKPFGRNNKKATASVPIRATWFTSTCATLARNTLRSACR